MSANRYDIQQVTSIVVDASGVHTHMADGSIAFLDRNHPAYDWILGRLRYAEKTGGVVGISVEEEGNIVDVGGAFRSPVAGIQQYRPGMPDIEVWFGGMDGPMRLAADLPEFSPLYEELVQAKKTGQPVWWVMKGGYLLDVRVLSSTEDAMVCRRIEQT